MQVYKLKERKTILISVFALGRAQEVLFMLKDLQDKDEICSDIPIRLDGNLSQIYTLMYRNANFGVDPGKESFLPNNFEFVTKENREEVLHEKKQHIILTTSGMMNHGPAQIYLPIYISREDVVIYIPGYVAPDTIAYEIQNPKNGQVDICGKKCEVKAEVLSTTEMSSHAKADELIDFISQFNHLQLVLVNHGIRDVKSRFALRIEKETNTKRVEILGDYTFRVCRYGYVKHMGAKFNIPKTKFYKKKKERANKKANKKQSFKRGLFKRKERYHYRYY